MGFGAVFWRLSILVAVISAVMFMPQLQRQRERLARFLSTCPLHWFESSFDSADGEGSDEDGDDGKVVKTDDSGTLLTKEELAMYDGTDGSKGLYIAILGRVYDVSSGASHYGPGGGYSFFAGKDGSRAFVTGEFNEEGLVDDISGLSEQNMLDLVNWISFYEKSYHYVGKLIGNFYDASGNPTQALLDAKAATASAFETKTKEEEQQRRFPPCNTHWSEATGSRVWCSDKSGGIVRDWEGLPRQLFDQTRRNTRCVCVKATGAPQDGTLPDTGDGDLHHPNLKLYEGCEFRSNTCVLR